jgi:predicted PurR-regulated permease PerM
MSLVILCLVLSFCLNILLLWYIRRMLKQLLNVSDNMGNLVEDLASYQNHLQQLYEMEMYYGEPSIKNLIVHSKQIIEHVREFSSVYNLMTDREDEINEVELE